MTHSVDRSTKKNEAEGTNKNKDLFCIILIFMRRAVQKAHEISQQFNYLIIYSIRQSTPGFFR